MTLIMILVFHFSVVKFKLGPKSFIFSYSCCKLASYVISKEREDQQVNEFESWWLLLLSTPLSAALWLIALFSLFPPFSVYTSNYIQQDGFYNSKILDLTRCDSGQQFPFSPTQNLFTVLADRNLTINESLYKICSIIY